jgi:hypothetical protein
LADHDNPTHVAIVYSPESIFIPRSQVACGFPIGQLGKSSPSLRVDQVNWARATHFVYKLDHVDCSLHHLVSTPTNLRNAPNITGNALPALGCNLRRDREFELSAKAKRAGFQPRRMRFEESSRWNASAHIKSPQIFNSIGLTRELSRIQSYDENAKVNVKIYLAIEPHKLVNTKWLAARSTEEL